MENVVVYLNVDKVNFEIDFVFYSSRNYPSLLDLNRPPLSSSEVPPASPNPSLSTHLDFLRQSFIRVVVFCYQG